MLAVTGIDASRARLAAAVGLREVLDAAWETFSLLLAACRDGELRSAELFAAFAFAASAAAEGRLVLDSAPMLPGGGRAAVGADQCVKLDLDHMAEDLASLAEALSERLRACAGGASDDSDRETCALAAAKAARISGLLAAGR